MPDLHEPVRNPLRDLPPLHSGARVTRIERIAALREAEREATAAGVPAMHAAQLSVALTMIVHNNGPEIARKIVDAVIAFAAGEREENEAALAVVDAREKGGAPS